MSWAVWLLVPVVVTVLAALASWWRHRPARLPDTAQAVREHGEFLDTLTDALTRAREHGHPGPDR